MALRWCWILIAIVSCSPARAAPDAGVPGAARVEWRIVDRARGPCECRDVGAGIVRVTARGPVLYEERFECLQSLAVTAALPAGTYAIALRLETDDGAVLASAQGRGVLGGELVDFGTFTLEVGVQE